MSLIHQKLYQDKNLATVEMKDYLETLAQTLLETYGNMEGRVQLHFPMQALELDVDTAIPLGLIANELITNSLKYAFLEGREGKIEVSLSFDDDQEYCLRVADDGLGIQDQGNESGTGFGSRFDPIVGHPTQWPGRNPGRCRGNNPDQIRTLECVNLEKSCLFSHISPSIDFITIWISPVY